MSLSDFYDNPVIGALAAQPRWTVSDSDKMPVDMRQLLDTGQLYGAQYRDARCLTTLDEIRASRFGDRIANHAFYLKASIDGVVILDIEKTCPPEIADRLLAMPSLYSETSMSGRGYHLVLPLPKNFDDFPLATTKPKLQHKQGWYEILLTHYITFTRQPIPPERLARAADSGPSLEHVFASLAADLKQTSRASKAIITSELDLPENHEKILVDAMLNVPFEKTLASFSHDHSRYEYAMAQHYLNTLAAAARADMFASKHRYTKADLAQLVCQALERTLDHRPKHDQERNGVRLLLNTAGSVIANNGDELDYPDA